MEWTKEFDRWINEAIDDDLHEELLKLSEQQVEEAFYANMKFGTGGLRGIIGAGPNRMNVYTVAKASQGLSDFLHAHKDNNEEISVVLGYDSRIKSELFARTAAEVFAANGIKVNIWRNLSPVSTVSYAVRYLNCDAGVMITASHNPCEYNGYKVYGNDGCQITSKAASAIFKEIEKLDIFHDIHKVDFNKAMKEKCISWIGDEVLDAFLNDVKRQSVLYGETINKDVSIVYSPLNGTGLVPVTRVLRDNGFEHITLVEEQKLPDGFFPTCPSPNPEIKEAMLLGIDYAKKENADLVIATDPDCDRVGIAVRDSSDEYRLLSGNETGVLLLDFICSQRKKHNVMPKDPVMMKTIVTTDLGERVANSYGVETINVLTGFKYIGEQIGLLEAKGKVDSYLFGFEESYGYLSGSYVRDKDGVIGTLLICDMFAYYKEKGVTLLDRLDEIQKKFGYYYCTQHTKKFPGAHGQKMMEKIMREAGKLFVVGTTLGDHAITEVIDYNLGVDGLPKSNVLKIWFENGASFVIRPSGTEPKMKIYVNIVSDCPAMLVQEEALLSKLISDVMEKVERETV